MRIVGIVLHPFAGLSRSFSFVPGLNVIHGPNEAGKSTLARAIQAALFIWPPERGRLPQQIADLLPIGEKTSRVHLEALVDGETLHLDRAWGAERAAQMRLGRAGAITDTDTIRQCVVESLGVTEGTFNNVLFAGQSQLGAALDALTRQGLDADLKDILRRAAMQTDGVSIEKLGSLLQRRSGEYFGRWERDLGRPEGNRGIDNPWKKQAEIGTVLRAWYEREKARQDRDDALQRELQASELERRANQLGEAVLKLEGYLTGNKQTFQAISKRRLLEETIGRLKSEAGPLTDILKSWPRNEQLLETLGPQVARLEALQKGLRAELATARRAAAMEGRVRKHQSASRKAEELEKARRHLQQLPAVDESRIKRIRGLAGAIAGYEAVLKAGHVGVTFKSRKAVTLTVSEAPGEEHEVPVPPGGTQSFSGSQVRLTHPDWEIEARTETANLEAVRADHARDSELLKEALMQVAVADHESAEAAYDAYQKASSAVQTLEGQLKETLGDDRLEDLAREAAQPADAGAGPRPVADVAVELERIGADLRTAQLQISNATNELAKWAKKHSTLDAAIEELGRNRSAQRSAELELQQLPTAPVGPGDISAFEGEYQDRERELPGKRTEYAHAREDLIKATSSTQADDIRFLEKREEEASAAFESAKREGEAVLKVVKTFERLKAEMAEQSLEPWLSDLAKVLRPLTADRYQGLDLAEQSAQRAGDDPGMPFGLLSTGTLAVVGLAVRLTVARRFLEGRDGFMIMDDPLVDLDPDRQHAASRVVREFANEKQVIVMTCHPEHAALLGGHRIDFA